jgi:hypothetical protein
VGPRVLARRMSPYCLRLRCWDSTDLSGQVVGIVVVRRSRCHFRLGATQQLCCAGSHRRSSARRFQVRGERAADSSWNPDRNLLDFPNSPTKSSHAGQHQAQYHSWLVRLGNNPNALRLLRTRWWSLGLCSRLTVRAARCQVRIGPFTAQCRSGRSLRRAGAACIRDTFPWFALKHGLVETEFAPSRRLPRGTDGHKNGEGRAGRAWPS